MPRAKVQVKPKKDFQRVKLDKLKVEYVPIDSVQPNAYNPNRQAEHEFNLLIKSMQEDGFTQPVIVLKKNREIVDGEHRWRAGHALGYKEIPVVFVDMTPEQMRVATLRHNRARGSEDAELAAVMLADMQKIMDTNDIADSLGLTTGEIEQLVQDFSDPQVLEQPEVMEADLTGDTSLIQDARRGAALRLEEQRQSEIVEAKIRDNDTYRVILTLTRDDADIVSSVLEPNPSARLLEICREELAKENANGTS